MTANLRCWVVIIRDMVFFGRALTRLSRSLQGSWVSDAVTTDDEAALAQLVQLLVDQGAGVSSFELWSSGLVDTLLQ